MEIIDVINPRSTRKRKFSCEFCGISYPKKEYRVLFDAKKIIFFEYPTEKKPFRLCHDCLYKVVLSIYEKDIQKKGFVKVTLKDDKKKYQCKFYPNDATNDVLNFLKK